MILINNPAISRFPFLVRPSDRPGRPSFVCRIFPFKSLIEAQQFAQKDGLVIPEYSIVGRFVGCVDGQLLPASINTIEEMDEFMQEAAAWLSKNWRTAGPSQAPGKTPDQAGNRTKK